LNRGIKEPAKPNIDSIFATMILYHDKFDYIGIAGGEPCLYLHELKELCERIKKYFPGKQLNLITAVPEICYQEKETFYEILRLCDTVTISPQHHKQEIADKIRGRKSGFDRDEFYRQLPYKEKISLTINLVKEYLDTFEDVKECLVHYNKLGFKNFKVCELFKVPSMFVDLEKLFGIHLKPAFAHGCSVKNYDVTKLIPEFDGNLTLKRTCFYNNCIHKATIWDFIKVCTRWMFRKKYFFGVVYGNGEIFKYWK
jgi:hypothetical protein